jgi:hypothetical protein
MKKINRIIILTLTLILIFTLTFIFFYSFFYYTFSTIVSNFNYTDSTIVFNLLSDLKAKGYKFILASQYSVNITKIYGKTVLIFHDCDFSINGLKTLTNIENSLGIRSSIYIRPNTEYFESNIIWLQSLEKQGWEIGYHYDTLSETENFSLALKIFEAQLNLLRTFFNITSTRPHGDKYNLKVYNYDLYLANIDLWKKLGIKEMIITESHLYLSDSNHNLIVPANINEDFVVLLLHSDWY